MNADIFLKTFESHFKQLVMSVDLFRVRPTNNDLLVSLRNERDFLTVVRSASSANIALEIGWKFEPREQENSEIGACFLRFQLSNACIDERLTVFLDQLSQSSRGRSL